MRIALPLMLMPVLAHLFGATPVEAQPSAETPAPPSLKVGDPSPPLRVERYLSDTPVAAFEKGHIYVVEFWATWCGPCVEALPHLSELQERYRDRGVTIIGVNVREMRREGGGYVDSFDEETRGKVEAFVRRQVAHMRYVVAYDGAARHMDTNWLKASGASGLPTAFIVDRAGRIAWFGHPIVLRMPLHEIVEGHWDASTSPARVKQAEDAYIGAMRLFTTDAAAGLAAWEQAEKVYPLLARDLLGPKFQALMAASQFEAAYTTGETLVDEADRTGNAALLNQVAWAIVNPNAKVANRNLALALRAAARADELARGQDPGIIDTLARVHFARGEVDRAITLQTRAIELADEPMKTRLAPALDEYTKARK